MESSRPDPTRPAISATRVGALKKPDFGTPVLVSFGAFLSLAPPRPARLFGPGPASPRPARLGFGWFLRVWLVFVPFWAWSRSARRGFGGLWLILCDLGLVLVGLAWFNFVFGVVLDLARSRPA